VWVVHALPGGAGLLLAPRSLGSLQSQEVEGNWSPPQAPEGESDFPSKGESTAYKRKNQKLMKCRGGASVLELREVVPAALGKLLKASERGKKRTTARRSEEAVIQGE